MKVLFLQEDIFVKMGICTLSSILKKKGHDVDILIENLEKNFLKTALEKGPDVIAFSATTPEIRWVLETARKLRPHFQGLIVCGGPHPTFDPSIVEREESLDLICRGEGEKAFSELLDKLESGEDITQIKNLWISKNGKVYKNEVRPLSDLNELPTPDRNIYEKYNFFRYRNRREVLTSRGCPYNCSFCSNRALKEEYKDKGKFVRRREIQDVINELKMLKSRDRVSHITFLDDIFILPPKSWLFNFLDEYKEQIGLPFDCNVRADLVNEEIIKKLKNSGCVSVGMGIESADDYIRNKVLKKGLEFDDILRACQLIKKYNIKLETYNMFGIPGESLNSALKTYRLNKKLRPTQSLSSLLQPYPGTEISQLMDNENNFTSLPSFFMDSLFDIPEKEKIKRLQKIFPLAVDLRLPEKFLEFLIKIPADKIYELIFKITYGIQSMKFNEISPKQAFKTFLKSRNYFKGIGLDE